MSSGKQEDPRGYAQATKIGNRQIQPITKHCGELLFDAPEIPQFNLSNKSFLITPIQVPGSTNGTGVIGALTGIPLYVGGAVGSILTWAARQWNFLRYAAVGVLAFLVSARCWSQPTGGHETVVVNPSSNLDI